LGFNPDFVWVKERSAGTYFHRLFDAVRGTSNSLYLPGTEAENTYSSGYANVSSFNSDGFTLTGLDGGNNSSVTYVAWAWDAGTTTTTNTVGSITSQVRANATAGFSVVTYTGNRTAGATVGHGLGVAPQFIFVKSRAVAGFGWRNYHASVGSTKYLLLNSTAAADTFSGDWNNTAPSSSVFTLGADGGSGNYPTNDTTTYVAYCFAPVVGYSSFGSYTGNGSADGPFVFCGFRPRYVLQKKTSDVSAWSIRDAARDPYNAANTRLWTNFSSAESSADAIDILSNGFKVRNTDTDWNASGATYIYAAFAESPFQYARAR
jgi:hypothetical protein